MKIGEIREVIDRLNWRRNDLSGATNYEFKNMDIPKLLIPQIEAVKALEIKPRFAWEIEHRDRSVASATKMLMHWYEMNGPKEALPC